MSSASILHHEFRSLGRVLQLKDQAPRLASDEFDRTLPFVGIGDFFCPPCVWDPTNGGLCYFASLRPDNCFHSRMIWMCIVDMT